MIRSPISRNQQCHAKQRVISNNNLHTHVFTHMRQSTSDDERLILCQELNDHFQENPEASLHAEGPRCLELVENSSCLELQAWILELLYTSMIRLDEGVLATKQNFVVRLSFVNLYFYACRLEGCGNRCHNMETRACSIVYLNPLNRTSHIYFSVTLIDLSSSVAYSRPRSMY